MGRPKGPDIKYRLLSKTSINDRGCLIFNGASRYGYGLIWKDGKNVLAHRESYRLFIGDLNDDEVVCHKCDTPLCVNHEHLFKGTRADNNRDMFDKKRHAYGEKSRTAKITEKDVEFIKSSPMTGKELGRLFGLNQSTISRIKNGKRWKHTIIDSPD